MNFAQTAFIPPDRENEHENEKEYENENENDWAYRS